MLSRKSWLLIGVVVSLVLCLGIVLVATSAGASNDKKWFLAVEETDAYEFPVYTGTEPLAWDDILAFLQVPDNILQEMSTDGVIETCLTYPILSIGMITSNTSMYAGFKNTLRDFNGFAELFRRDDAGQKLLALYQGISQGEAVRSSDSYIFRMRFIEYLLAQDEILTKLGVEERSILQDTCVRNMVERVQKYDGELPTDSVFFVIVRISYLDNPTFTNYAKEHGKVMFFINEGLMPLMEEQEIAEFDATINIQWGSRLITGELQH
jgi:hypothetical protein